MKAWISLLAAAAVSAAGAAEQATLTIEQRDGRDILRLENYRAKLAIDPGRGGAVTSYSDKMAPAELVPQKEYHGLCMDHFQEQNWPGEFLEVPYEYRILKQTPEEIQIMAWRKSSGVWREKLPNSKISGILLEKTYTLRANSPSLDCSVKLTAPPDESKVFSYWLQNVFFAGGDYDAAADRTCRPSARGVRNSGREENGHYGMEEWLRDFSDGWMALVDTGKKSGLAMTADYNEMRVSYANQGNCTSEFMFNTVYLPAGQSRLYVVQFTPLTGMQKLLHAGNRLIVGYSMKSDDNGSGRIDFIVQRSAEAVKDVKFDITLAGVLEKKQTRAGTLEFGAPADQPLSKSLAFSGGPRDPIVVRVAAKGRASDGEEFKLSFEDFHSGAYKWADNIQTDMRTPVYVAERPEQTLNLARPAQLRIRRQYGGRRLFFQGLLDEEYNVAAALHSLHYQPACEVIHYRYGGSWFGEISDFPYDYEKLLSYDCIVLGGVSRSGLKPVGLEMLHDYLLAGGGMIVLGSHGAYGRSQLKGTKLGAAFPVEFSESVFDLEPTGGRRVTEGPDAIAFLKYNSLSEKAACYFIHPATPKPGAKVLFQVDGRPFIVAGEYGPNNARIICILGAPMGNPGKGETPFWLDNGWYLVLRNAIWWASREDFHFEE